VVRIRKGTIIALNLPGLTGESQEYPQLQQLENHKDSNQIPLKYKFTAPLLSESASDRSKSFPSLLLLCTRY
jgi:hypothetical protein